MCGLGRNFRLDLGGPFSKPEGAVEGLWRVGPQVSQRRRDPGAPG